jgi:hypothetical protein
MHSVLNCHNVTTHTEFYLGQLQFNTNFTLVLQSVSQKELQSGIPNVTVQDVE